jgi:hypothetical protein
VNSHDPLQCSHLVGCETYPTRGIQGFDHIGGKIPDFVVDAPNYPAFFTQNRIGEHPDSPDGQSPVFRF